MKKAQEKKEKEEVIKKIQEEIQFGKE